MMMYVTCMTSLKVLSIGSNDGIRRKIWDQVKGKDGTVFPCSSFNSISQHHTLLSSMKAYFFCFALMIIMRLHLVLLSVTVIQRIAFCVHHSIVG